MKKELILKAPVLRDYQLEAMANMGVVRKQGNRSIMLKAPTGAGKTVVASSILYNCFIANKKAIIICDRIELINQTSDTLLKYGIDHGVIQASHPKENWKKNIQVASIQTLQRRMLEKLLADVDMVLIDEAHTLHAAHIRIIKTVLEINKKATVLGLSATPFTRGLGKFFSKCVPVASTKQLIELGFLCKPIVFAPSTPDLEKIKVVKGDYDQTELEKEVIQPKLVGDIIEHWIKLCFDKPTICFATSINHSKAIVEEFQKRGIQAMHIDAYTDSIERKKIIRSFKSGAIKVLSSVDILSKGFDYPGAEVAILARPTKSLSLYLQQAGRVLRISPETGKKGCIILDHAGNTERLGFVTNDTTNELNKGEKTQASTVVKEKQVKAPAICPSCFMVKETAICQNCGFEHKPKNTIVSADGYLVLINDEEDTGKKINISVKDILMKDKQNLYQQLVDYCIKKGWKEGRAYFIYKDITGEEPEKNFRFGVKCAVTMQLTSYLKHLQIKQAKSKFYNKSH